jgi:hypothetical protein
MGLEQGRELRQQIWDARECLRELEAFRLEQPRWLPYPLFLRLAEARSANALLPALQRLSPSVLARLRGIANGSGLPLRSLCLMNAMEAFISSMEGRTVSVPLGGCSAVAVRRSLAEKGEPMVAKAFDYIPLLQPFYILRECRPRGGFRSLEFAVAPQVGAVDHAQLRLRDRRRHARAPHHDGDRRGAGAMRVGERSREIHHPPTALGRGDAPAGRRIG